MHLLKGPSVYSIVRGRPDCLQVRTAIREQKRVGVVQQRGYWQLPTHGYWQLPTHGYWQLPTHGSRSGR